MSYIYQYHLTVSGFSQFPDGLQKLNRECLPYTPRTSSSFIFSLSLSLSLSLTHIHRRTNAHTQQAPGGGGGGGAAGTSGSWFCKNEVQPGLFPMLLQQLLNLRVAAKTALKNPGFGQNKNTSKQTNGHTLT